MNVLVLGGTGYTGTLLLKLLSSHPKVERIWTTSYNHVESAIDNAIFPEAYKNKFAHERYLSLEEASSNNISYDVIFSALPHGISAKHCVKFLPKPRKYINTMLDRRDGMVMPTIIDLSADFRFTNISHYEEIYQDMHPAPHLTPKAVYGLSEWNREKLLHTSIIACPGCYSTSVLLPLIPVARTIEFNEQIINVCSISGISGAGSSPKKELLYSERTENMSLYSPGTTHRHTREITQQIKNIAYQEDYHIVFNPHLAPLRQGMLTTITIPTSSKHDADRAVDAIQSQYVGEQFVSVLPSPAIADTQCVRGTNHAMISTHVESNCIVVNCVIDNLWKGAASQAIQNFNIRFGFPEDTALQQHAIG